MCGIAGVLRFDDDGSDSGEIVRNMAKTMVHRGPDCEGFVNCHPCYLGFQRLAIIDLKAESPPLPNEDKTVWSIANAEIYNSDNLRSRLIQKGHQFRCHVDTEVLPHMWEEFGPDLLQQLNGMFAFAIWDTKQQSLLLARDRAGEKPLYFWYDSKELVFASELRAILAHPRVPSALDPVALRRYLMHGYFPAPISPIAGIHKLPAGHFLVVKNGCFEMNRYWDLADYFGNSQPGTRGVGDIVEELDGRISEAVKLRRRSDVSLGVFLSGGIDSSSILAHLADQVGQGVHAFSVGHKDPAFDESRIARNTARYFGADFNELILDQSDLEEGLRLVGRGIDEPLGDASTIPTLLLSHFTSQKVKVVLSGEGADELFGGYPTYLGNKIAGAYQQIPQSLRSILLAVTRKVTPVSMGNVGIDYLLERFTEGADMNLVERHQTWFGCLIPEFHFKVLSERVGKHLSEDDPFGSFRDKLQWRDFPDSLAELLYMDFAGYLQDDLLTKIDRSTMLASIEARTPFLDHELAQYVAGIPSSLKVKGFTTKSILRKAVRKRLPGEVLRQRKRGFNIPFSKWLLHGLGDELRIRFSDERVAARGLFSSAGISQLIIDHMDRKADHRKPLFTLLAFDMWCDAIYGPGNEVPIANNHNPLNETGKSSTRWSLPDISVVSGST